MIFCVIQMIQPTIGLLLVKRKNKLVAEYALRGYIKPIGVAQWQARITHSLPAFLKTSLPTIEEIEKELSKGIDKAKNFVKLSEKKKGKKVG